MSTTATSFYITGGTLRQDVPSYVERQADMDDSAHAGRGAAPPAGRLRTRCAAHGGDRGGRRRGRQRAGRDGDRPGAPGGPSRARRSCGASSGATSGAAARGTPAPPWISMRANRSTTSRSLRTAGCWRWRAETGPSDCGTCGIDARLPPCPRAPLAGTGTPWRSRRTAGSWPSASPRARFSSGR
jgi:hypothetical protein